MKRNAGRESKKAVGNVPNDILVQRMSSAASGRLKKYEHWIREISFLSMTMKNCPWRTSKKHVKSSTTLCLDRAISSRQLEALHARNWSRLKVAKCTSSHFFHPMRMPVAYLDVNVS